MYRYVIKYNKYLLDTGIIFLVNSFDKIQQLFSCFISVTMGPHLVIGMVISTKYIQNSFYLLNFGYLGLGKRPRVPPCVFGAIGSLLIL